MKRIKGFILTILLMLFFFFYVYAAGISISASSLTIDVGGSKSFTIKASSAAGRVDISSSDKSVATVSSASQFLDNSSVKITVKGKKEGKAKITIKLTDVATYEGKSLSGIKTVTITVKKPTPKVVVPKVMSITKFEVVGYDLNFNVNTTEYTIDVDKNVKKLYVLIEGKNYTASGDKVVNIENKDSFNVSLKDDNGTKTYTIKLNKVSNNNVTPTPPEEKIRTVTVEKEVKNNTYLYTTIGLGVLCLILLILYLTKKPKDTEVKPNVEPQIVNENPGVTYQPNNNFNVTPTQYPNNTQINNDINNTGM